MTARIRKYLADLRETFWVVPALLVLAGVIAAPLAVALDQSAVLPDWLVEDSWLYGGGATGARALLGAIATSTITVAGTVFTITIAALTLAAGQMGPRLLRNFTNDRGNQLALGAFLATFVYALLVLRAVRAETEGAFVPHLAVTVGIALALVCVGALVWFVDHMAGRINVDTVIDLVSRDLRQAIRRAAVDAPGPPPPPVEAWSGGVPVIEDRRGYLQQLDNDGLARWAYENGTSLRLLKRPGDPVFRHAPIAIMSPPVAGAREAIVAATALGDARNTTADLELSVRQLVEVALRALSPGINDPQTAISVLDELGAALCELVPCHLPAGVHECGGRIVLIVPATTYDGLCDQMFHAIRQNAVSNPAVLIRMLEVLGSVASAEASADRVATLRRHAALVMADAERSIHNRSDLEDLRQRQGWLIATRAGSATPGSISAPGAPRAPGNPSVVHPIRSDR